MQITKTQHTEMSGLILEQRLLHVAQIVGTFFTLVLMTASVFVGTIPSHESATAWAPVFGIGWAFFLARLDFIIHRNAANIRCLLVGKPNFEEWKSNHSATPFAIPLLDIGAMIPIFVLFIYAEWNQPFSNDVYALTVRLFGEAILPDSFVYTIVTVPLFLLGLAMIPLAVKMAYLVKSPQQDVPVAEQDIANEQ